MALQARLTGLEPATPGLTARCSDQLSYSLWEVLPSRDSNPDRPVNSRSLCH